MTTESERDKNGHLKAGIRLPGWDYCKPWFYMITLVVKRRRPILGEIVDGKLLPSPLGEAVAQAWRELGQIFPEVEPCQFAVMPEHFHGIVWVHERLKSPLGEVIRSFKIACTKANIALDAPILIDGSTTFWFPGLYDTILFGKGQLKAMTRYVLRNAERRWAVMQNPDLFKVTRSLKLSELLIDALGERVAKPAGVSPADPHATGLASRSLSGDSGLASRSLSGDSGLASRSPSGDLGLASRSPSGDSGLASRSLSGDLGLASRSLSGDSPIDLVGNHFLIDLPNKMLIQVSRRATPAEIDVKINEALLFGQRGGAIVSGCISPGEQAVARAVREAGFPLIAIVPRGFGPYFKPSGAYFDACAAGKLLMLSPFPQIGKTEKLTRERCFGINTVAAAICGEDPDTIRYRGSQPGQFGAR